MVPYPHSLRLPTFIGLHSEACPGSLPLSALTNETPSTSVCYGKAALVWVQLGLGQLCSGLTCHRDLNSAAACDRRRQALGFSEIRTSYHDGNQCMASLMKILPWQSMHAHGGTSLWSQLCLHSLLMIWTIVCVLMPFPLCLQFPFSPGPLQTHNQSWPWTTFSVELFSPTDKQNLPLRMHTSVQMCIDALYTTLYYSDTLGNSYHSGCS